VIYFVDKNPMKKGWGEEARRKGRKGAKGRERERKREGKGTEKGKGKGKGNGSGSFLGKKRKD
jgi:hypothetical protein